MKLYLRSTTKESFYLSNNSSSMLNQDKHRQIMFQIIKDIFSDPIGKYLAFKWGTACYFLYGLDRFSTDLDFDLVEEINIDDKIIALLQKYWSIKKWQKIILSYGDHDINIKIDISRKIRSANQYTLIDFYGTLIRTQNKATVFANKLVALTERSTNRDIYDVYFFFQQLFDINEHVIAERTWSDLRTLYTLIIKKLQSLPKTYKILDGLWEVLNTSQKQRVKEHLVSDLISLMTMKLQFMR